MKYALENGALNYLEDLLEDKKYCTERLEDAYVILKSCRNQRNKLEEEKKQLISYLKQHIEHLENIIYKNKIKPYGEELHLLENSLNRYKDVLGFINKGGKDEL